MAPMPEAKSEGNSLTPTQIDAWRRNIRDSTFANYHLEMGKALNTADTQPQAERHFREALRLYPEAPEAALALSALLTKQGRASEVASIDETATRRDPQYPLRRLTHGLPDTLPDAPAELLRHLESLERETEHSVPDLAWRRGFLLLMLNDSVTAETLFSRHTTDQLLWPDAVAAFGAEIALSLYSDLSTNAASMACRQALALDPHSARLWLADATLALGRRDWGSATIAGRHRQDLRPDDVLSQEIPILALLGQSKFEEARRLLEDFRSAGKGSPQLNSRSAIIDLSAGRLDAAESTLTAGLRDTPTDMLMNVDKALLCGMTARPSEADKAIGIAANTHGLPFLARAVMRRSWLASILVPCLTRNGLTLPSDMLADLGQMP
jgi:tetratricopeptide (TPR) repeat protein